MSSANGKPSTTDIAYALSQLDTFPATERGNAQLFASMFASQVRYDADRDIWLTLSNSTWHESPHVHAVIERMHLATIYREQLALSIPACTPEMLAVSKLHLAWAKKSGGYQIARNSVRWAESLSEILLPPDALDHDPWLVGTPSGVLNLVTGRFYTGTVEPYVSKRLSLDPAPVCEPQNDKDELLQNCPTWIRFLVAAMGGGEVGWDKVAYLQRLSGYLLTGLTSEQSLHWFVGDGGNGKSTYLETLADIMGDYAHPLRSEILMASRHEQHSTELYDILGRRLVMTSEAEEGRVWRQSLLKKLTGGDRITARRVHKDAVSFVPTHKLIISCNESPMLKSVGRSERRRFQVLEWNCDFTPEDGFREKIVAEYPAILRWMLEGTRKWRITGLRPPESVLLSSDSIMQEQDVLGQWIEQFCILESDAWMPSIDLWQSWQRWCVLIGNRQEGGIRNFIPRLLRKTRTDTSTVENVRGVSGIRLNEDAVKAMAQLARVKIM